MVIAAGSVKNEPSNGATMKMASHHAPTVPRPQRSHSAQASLRNTQNRARAGDGHDDHYEHRLGEVHLVSDVIEHG